MTTLISSTEKINATEFTMEANVISLNRVPTIEEQNKLFSNDSIVLEF